MAVVNDFPPGAPLKLEEKTNPLAVEEADFLWEMGVVKITF